MVETFEEHRSRLRYCQRRNDRYLWGWETPKGEPVSFRRYVEAVRASYIGWSRRKPERAEDYIRMARYIETTVRLKIREFHERLELHRAKTVTSENIVDLKFELLRLKREERDYVEYSRRTILGIHPEYGTYVSRLEFYRERFGVLIDYLEGLIRREWVSFVHVVAVATTDKRFGNRHVEAHCECTCLNSPEARNRVVSMAAERWEGIAHEVIWDFIREAEFMGFFTNVTNIREGTEWGEMITKPERIEMRLTLFDFNYPVPRPRVEPLTKFLKTDADVGRPKVKARAVFEVPNNYWEYPVSDIIYRKRRVMRTYIGKRGRQKKLA